MQIRTTGHEPAQLATTHMSATLQLPEHR